MGLKGVSELDLDLENLKCNKHFGILIVRISYL